MAESKSKAARVEAEAAGDTAAVEATEDTAAVEATPARKGPSFGMSEGTREELERTGHAVDPFTGRALTRDDLTA